MDKDLVDLWAFRGTVGDTLGGFSNLVTMLVVLYGANWARREVRRARQLLAHETQVASARDLWRATSGLTKACGVVVQMLVARRPFGEFQSAVGQLPSAHDRFTEVLADSSLFFPYDVFVTVDKMNHATAKLFSTLTPFGGPIDPILFDRLTDSQIADAAKAYDEVRQVQGQIFARLGRAVHVDDFEAWENVMRPFLADMERRAAVPSLAAKSPAAPPAG